VPYRLKSLLLSDGPGGVDGGGGGMLSAEAQHVSSGNGCWELELPLALHRYGNQTYAVNVSVHTLSGWRSTVLELHLVIDAVNDMPSFSLSSPAVVVTENEFVSSRYDATVASHVTAGPFEPLQAFTFTVTLGCGDKELFAEHPRLHANGSLSFRLQAMQRGSAQFTVHLTDDGVGLNTSEILNLTIYVIPVNRAPSFLFSSPIALGGEFMAMSDGRLGNGSVVLPETLLSVVSLPSFAKNITRASYR